jgi:hypothetical protein
MHGSILKLCAARHQRRSVILARLLAEDAAQSDKQRREPELSRQSFLDKKTSMLQRLKVAT